MANILSQDELDALLKEMKQLREEESKESDVHISSNAAAGPTRSYQEQMSSQQPEVNLEVTLNLPVNVSAELGRARLSVHEILQLTQGSMIELDNKAKSKAPLSLMIKDQLLAQGEVVVKDEKFAIRVMEIDPIKDRIQKIDR